MRAAHVLSIVVAVLAAVASAGGLIFPGLYRDNTWITSAWKGTDLVTLACVIPLLLVSLRSARHGVHRAQLVWLAMLAYMIYGYAYYLFGAAFNQFFLIYTAIFACSILALVAGANSIDVAAIGREFSGRTPVRYLAGYSLTIALGLTGAWVAMCVGFIFTGKVPEPIVASGHPTGIVFALDLSLLVPGYLLAAVWLWRRHPPGYVLGAIMMIKGATYTLALTVTSVFAARAGVGGAAREIPVWITLTILSTIASLMLLGGMRRQSSAEGRDGVPIVASATASKP